MSLVKLYRDPEATPAASAGGEPPAAAPAQAGSASISLPLPAAGASPEPAKAPETPSAFTIPDSYKDKAYLKGVDSMDKVFKMLDGAQELIGKRPAGIPTADSTPEEKAKFYEALGKPKTSAEYQFEGAEKADPKFLPKVQEAFHKHNLSQEQAKGVYSDVLAALGEVSKEKGLEAQQQDIDFDALADKTFGVNRDKVLSTAKSLIDQNVSPSMKPYVEKLPNESLIVLADVLRGINSKYIKQDGPPGGAPTNNGMTRADISAKGRELMMTPAYTDPFHPNHAAVAKQVKEIYDSLK